MIIDKATPLLCQMATQKFDTAPLIIPTIVQLPMPPPRYRGRALATPNYKIINGFAVPDELQVQCGAFVDILV